MKKLKPSLKVLCSFLFFSLSLINIVPAQEALGTFGPPKISPVSPQVAGMVRYGNVPVNLANGKLGMTIPFYEIQEDEFSLPILLSYDYGGLLLDSKPTSGGLGWNLVAGGAIAREVRGLPDDAPYGFYGDHFGKNTVDYYLNGGALSFQAYSGFVNGSKDAEPDIFHVSLGNMNFSFKLGDSNPNLYQIELVPVSLSEHNYIIDFSWNEITITDEYGTTYIFNNRETNNDSSNEEFPEYTTSWNISSITTYTGKNISFTYAPHTYDDFSFYEYSQENDLLINNQGDPGNSQGATQETNITSKILSSIAFPKGSLDFGYNLYHNVPLYNQISLHNKNGGLVKNYELYYSKLTQRALLDSISLNQQRHYNFEYYNTSGVPSYATTTGQINKILKQDLWGYYNGASNSYLVENKFASIFPNKHADFENSRKGALKKIQYETGGVTEIEYGSNQIKSSVNSAFLTTAPKLTRRIELEFDNLTNSNYTEKIIEVTFAQTTFARMSHFFKIKKTNGHVQAHISNVAGNSGACENANLALPYNDAAAWFRIQPPFDKYPTICPIYEIDDHGDGITEDYGYDIGDSDGIIKILPGTYELRIWGKLVYGNFTIDYTTLDGDFNQDVGGIRVSEIKNYSDEITSNNSSLATVKNFNYNDSNGFSNGIEVNRPVRQFTFGVAHYIPYGSGCWPSPDFYNRRVGSYRSYNAFNLKSSSPVVYPRVREYSAPIIDSVSTTIEALIVGNEANLTSLHDSFDYIYTATNGYTDNEYKVGYLQLNTPDDYPFEPQGTDKLDLTLLNSKNFKYNSNNQSYSLEKEQVFDYSVKGNLANNPPEFYPEGLKVGFVYKVEGCGWIPNIEDAPDYFDVVPYKDVDNDMVLTKKTQWSYLNGQLVENIEDYQYNESYLINSIRSTTSEDPNKTFITKHYYPMDSEVENDPNMSTLRDANRIAIPIKSIEAKGDLAGTVENLLTTKHSTYKNWGSGLVMPEFVKGLKEDGTNGNLGTRVIFHEYDSNGNPLEVSQAAGTPTSYIWGYDGQYPVAKIDNATYSQATDPNIGLSMAILNNPATDQELENEINKIRLALPNAQVTAYSYKPLIGVSTITDPRGQTSHYKYDDLNRLEYILDADDNILKKYTYNFKKERFKGDGGPIEGTLTSSYVADGSNVTFDVRTNLVGGSANTSLWSYDWSFRVNNGSWTSISPTQEALVDYSLPTSAGNVCYKDVEFKCVISCTGFDSITLNDTIELIECPIASGIITVNIDSATYNTVSFSGSVGNITGGSDNLTYQWYYRLGTGAWEGFSSGSINTFSLDVVDACCENINFKCVISNYPDEDDPYNVIGYGNVVECLTTPFSGGSISENVTSGSNNFTVHLSVDGLQGGVENHIVYKWSYSKFEPNGWDQWLWFETGTSPVANYIVDGNQCCSSLRFKCEVFNQCDPLNTTGYIPVTNPNGIFFPECGTACP